jgi:hypothetical protein
MLNALCRLAAKQFINNFILIREDEHNKTSFKADFSNSYKDSTKSIIKSISRQTSLNTMILLSFIL